MGSEARALRETQRVVSYAPSGTLGEDNRVRAIPEKLGSGGGLYALAAGGQESARVSAAVVDCRGSGCRQLRRAAAASRGIPVEPHRRAHAVFTDVCGAIPFLLASVLDHRLLQHGAGR